jgi:hypothetical protein
MSSHSITWTPEQLEVIDAERSARQLVQAGPGTGKTAVACARVANLIEKQNVLPHEIFLISFTNAAIHELRNRIKSYLSDPDLASGLRITTIDSFAASLQSGFVPGAIFSGGFTGITNFYGNANFNNDINLMYDTQRIRFNQGGAALQKIASIYYDNTNSGIWIENLNTSGTSRGIYI